MNEILDNVVTSSLIDYADNIKLFFAGLLKDGFTFELFFKILILYFVLIWFGIIVWTAKDIVNRTDSLIYQLIGVLLVIVLTPLGIFVYFLIRPQYTLAEKYSNAGIEQELEYLDEEILKCKNCSYELDESFKSCPMCMTRTGFVCLSCDSNVLLNWSFCPICENDLKQDEALNILDNEDKNNIKSVFSSDSKKLNSDKNNIKSNSSSDSDSNSKKKELKIIKINKN